LIEMKLGIVLLSVIAVVYGQCNWDLYWVPATSSLQMYYDLSGLELSDGTYSYDYVDYNASKFWIFSVCGNLDNEWNSFTDSRTNCKNDSVACFQDSSSPTSTWYSAGTYSSAVYENSVYGDDQGISVTYSNGDSCGWGYRSSRFDFVCDPNYNWAFVTNVESYDCFDIIRVNSSYACPSWMGSDESGGVTTESWSAPQTGYTGVITTETTTSSKPIGKIIGMAIGSFVGTAILCTILVCCCVRRQERRKQLKQLQEMRTISVPQPTQPFSVPQFTAQPFAGAQPQMPYPQYYFYYPPQTQSLAKPESTQPAPSLVPLEEPMSDEQYAKKLQAEFDKEVHN